MNIDIQSDFIGAEEYDRLRDVYEPLTQSIRRLIGAGIRTGMDDGTIHDAKVAIDAIAETLERTQAGTTSMLRHADTGRPLAWSNPAIGLRNAMAPPMEINQDGDGHYWSEFTLGAAYEGPPGLVHGGIGALVLDHILGEAASEGLTKPLFTGTITLRYLRGTPLGALRAEAFVERTEGFKTYARGFLGDADGPTVEADGVFIRPAWARDFGGQERSDSGDVPA